MNYTTQTEAQIFCTTFNRVDLSGRTASWERVGPNQYQVAIQECPELLEHFFGVRKAA